LTSALVIVTTPAEVAILNLDRHAEPASDDFTEVLHVLFTHAAFEHSMFEAGIRTADEGTVLTRYVVHWYVTLRVPKDEVCQLAWVPVTKIVQAVSVEPSKPGHRSGLVEPRGTRQYRIEVLAAHHQVPSTRCIVAPATIFELDTDVGAVGAGTPGTERVQDGRLKVHGYT